MTWQHVARTLAVAFFGALALVLASQARAEGGEGSSVLLPDNVAAQAAAAESVSEEASEQAAAEDAQSKKPGKEAVKAAKKKTKVLAAAPEKGLTEQSEFQLAAEAVAQKDAPTAEEVEEALPAGEADRRLKPRLADAVRGHALKPLIARYASESGVPFELADAVVRLESRYNAGARNGPNMGLTQINFRTAQSLGYQGAAAGLLEAETNLRYGLKYLAVAYRLAGGDVCGTILRYQFGHRTQTMTSASRAYCAKVKVITAAAN